MLVFSVPSAAVGQESGAVDASVTVATPCITVDATPVSFGTLRFNDGDLTLTPGSPKTVVTNCSGGDEQVLAAGSDYVSSDGSITWALSNFQCPSGGPNKVMHWLANDSHTAHLTTTPQPWTFGGVSDSPTLGSGESSTFGHYIRMPCEGSDGAGATFSTRVTFTATF